MIFLETAKELEDLANSIRMLAGEMKTGIDPKHAFDMTYDLGYRFAHVTNRLRMSMELKKSR